MAMASGGSADGTLAEVSAAIAITALGVQAILTTATTTLSRIKPGTWVAVVMNPHPDTSQVMVADDRDVAMANYIKEFMATVGQPGGGPTIRMSQQVIETGHPIFNPNMPFDDLLSLLSPAGQIYYAGNKPPLAIESVGVLVVPMHFDGATIGTLGIFDWHPESSLGEADVEWLQPIADLVARSLEHARLAAASRDQVERLAVLEGVALAIRYGQDIRLTLRVIVEQVTGRLRIDAADLLLVSEQGNQLSVAVSAGFHSPSMPDYQLPMDAEQSGPATSRPHVEHLGDPDHMGRSPRRSLFAREGFQTYVAVPLLARNKIVGVLEIYNRSTVEWDQDWLDFFDALGGMAGVAIGYAALTAPPDVAEQSRTGAPCPRMSDFEMQILRLIVEGFTNRDISQQVFRSENTIKFHVRRILERANASNRTQLARKATREGWL
jgi:GAF domain-containing protein/DNA-binding CsgD family transcriptional regulator